MNLDNPLVSIVIPVYNGSDFISEAIKSAINQTYKNIEILVVNDGSNDNLRTENICKSYNNKIRYFYKENGGVGSALNLGIKKSRGKYFSWLSHDDLYKPNKIEKQLEFFQKNPSAKIVCSDFEILNNSNNIIKLREMKGIGLINNGRGVLDYWLDFCTFLINVDCFSDVGLFDKNLKTVQDLDMQFRLVSRFNIFHINEILSTRREHPLQGTKTQQSNHFKELDTFVKNIYIKYGLKFLRNSSETDFTTYFNLGLRTMKMSCNNVSRFFYFKALMKKPFSPRLLTIVLFGKRAFNFFYD